MANEKSYLDHGCDGKAGRRDGACAGGQGFQLRAMTRKPESDAARGSVGDGRRDRQGRSRRRGVAEGGAGRRVGRLRRAEHMGSRRRGKRSRASASRRSRARPACSTTSTRRWDRRTARRAFRTSTTSGASRTPFARLGFPSHVILRPVFFMENLPSPWFLNGDNVYAAMRADDQAADDRGGATSAGYGARAFTDAAAEPPRDRYRRRRGDDARSRRGAERRAWDGRLRSCRFRSRKSGRTARTSALMLEWFERVGYDADIPALEREFGIRPTTLVEWAETQRQ